MKNDKEGKWLKIIRKERDKKIRKDSDEKW